MNIQADKRADLDLQVSLLTEPEVTRLIHLVTAIAKKMDITEAHHPEIEELSKDVQPGKVLDTMEAQQKDRLHDYRANYHSQDVLTPTNPRSYSKSVTSDRGTINGYRVADHICRWFGSS